MVNLIKQAELKLGGSSNQTYFFGTDFVKAKVYMFYVILISPLAIKFISRFNAVVFLVFYSMLRFFSFFHFVFFENV